jgi:hypothetical protein
MRTNFRQQWDFGQISNGHAAGLAVSTPTREHALQKNIPPTLQKCGRSIF